jgi:hypothetical protein
VSPAPVGPRDLALDCAPHLRPASGYRCDRARSWGGSGVSEGPVVRRATRAQPTAVNVVVPDDDATACDGTSARATAGVRITVAAAVVGCHRATAAGDAADDRLWVRNRSGAHCSDGLHETERNAEDAHRDYLAVHSLAPSPIDWTLSIVPPPRPALSSLRLSQYVWHYGPQLGGRVIRTPPPEGQPDQRRSGAADPSAPGWLEASANDRPSRGLPITARRRARRRTKGHLPGRPAFPRRSRDDGQDIRTTPAARTA